MENILGSKAGIELRLFTNSIITKQGYPEPTGQAKITPGYCLPARYVLHTVGPIVQGPLTDEHRDLLRSSYRSCLELAEKNGLSVGDTVTLSVVEGVRDWLENAYGTQVNLKIVGIYATTHNEPASPSTPESELQENIFFTDSTTAKELFVIRFPNRTIGDYTYSSGIMLFLKDPSRMDETVSLLKQQPCADWDGLVVTPNDTAYQKAAGPILKAATISRFMLLTILVISIVILALILLMWTRERVHEIGILISLGRPAGDIYRQLLLENYIVAVPAYIVSVLISAILAGQLVSAVSGASVQVHLDAVHAVLVLACSAGVIFLAVLIASAAILRKKPREILIDLI